MYQKFDVVLLEKPDLDGLTLTDTVSLYGMLNAEEAYPLEIGNTSAESTAIGYITPDAAETLEYDYGQASDFGKFIDNILGDMNLETEDGAYHYRNISVWLGRNFPTEE